MHPAIADKLDDIIRLCREHGVVRLEIFGSAARGYDFDPATSDADFLVEFSPAAKLPWMEHYFLLERALSKLLVRKVDVTPVAGDGKPRVLDAIRRDRQLIYG